MPLLLQLLVLFQCLCTKNHFLLAQGRVQATAENVAAARDHGHGGAAGGTPINSFANLFPGFGVGQEPGYNQQQLVFGGPAPAPTLVGNGQAFPFQQHQLNQIPLQQQTPVAPAAATDAVFPLPTVGPSATAFASTS
eukprot:GSA120T00007918001.1